MAYWHPGKEWIQATLFIFPKIGFIISMSLATNLLVTQSVSSALGF
jgi:hypothetical protein